MGVGELEKNDMDLRSEVKRKAEKLASDDYAKKFHRLPNLNNVCDYTRGFGCEIVISFEADDMAYYHFVYRLETHEFEMYTFYRDNVKMWREET